MVSALTNGGKLVIPKIQRSRINRTSFRGLFKREIGVAPNIYERVIPGMIRAVDYGTAKRMNKANMNIAGKTGSCIADKTWVGLFASVAPIQDPRFSVVVITKGTNARGKYSAAIAGKIYQALRPRFNQRFAGTVARKTVIVQSTPRNSVQTSSAINRQQIRKTENRKDSPAIGQNTPQKEKNEKVQQKPKSLKELFPTVIINGKTEITRPRIVRN
jgi:hypothetical protein